MVSKEERSKLWQTFTDGQQVPTARLEELAWADLNDLADQVRARLDHFDTDLTDRQIAAEVRHEALWMLTEQRQTGEELPEMATAF